MDKNIICVTYILILLSLFRTSPTDTCLFGSTATKPNSYLNNIRETPRGSYTSLPGDAGDDKQYPMTQIAKYLRDNSLSQTTSLHQDFLSFLYNDSHNINPVPPNSANLYNMEVNPNQPNFTRQYTYGDAPAQYFTVRTCNSYFNPQGPIIATGVDSLFLGMASQRCEREDFIITPDLRGSVCSVVQHVLFSSS